MTGALMGRPTVCRLSCDSNRAVSTCLESPRRTQGRSSRGDQTESEVELVGTNVGRLMRSSPPMCEGPLQGEASSGDTDFPPICDGRGGREEGRLRGNNTRSGTPRAMAQ